MEKTIRNILKSLSKSHLLNLVGEILAEQPEIFPETYSNIAEYFDGTQIEYIEKRLVTSLLVGPNDELTIEKWVAEEEQGIMYKIIDTKNNVELYEIYDGEWLSENGRWSVTKQGVYFNDKEGSEAIDISRVNVPDEVQKIYDNLQGD